MPFDADDVFEAANSQRKFPMHSHDRTLLASLGFADPDKGNPEHDTICRYLTRPETVGKISDWLFGYVGAPLDVGAKSVVRVVQPVPKAMSEYHLAKGSGEYKSTVGFIDILYEFRDWGYDYKCGDDTSFYDETPFRVFAEIKVARSNTGDILRQMQLYKSYLKLERYGRINHVPVGLLIAPWDMTKTEIALFKKEDIAFVKLGDEYKKWSEEDAKVVGKPHFTL